MTDVQEKIKLPLKHEVYLKRIERIYMRDDAYGFLMGRPELLEAVEKFAEKAYPWDGDRALFIGLDELQAKYYRTNQTDVMLFGASIAYGIEQDPHEYKEMRIDRMMHGGLRVTRQGDISMNT